LDKRKLNLFLIFFQERSKEIKDRTKTDTGGLE